MEALIGVIICFAILGVVAFLLAFVFHDNLGECKKTLLALAIFLGTACAYVLHFDPSFGIALSTLVGGAFGVIGVFTAPQFSEQDLSKSISGVAGALFSVLQFFNINNPGVQTQVFTLIGLGVAAFSIWYINNAGHRTPAGT